MKYTEKYLELNEQSLDLVSLLRRLAGLGVKGTGSGLGAAGIGDIFRMAQTVGQGIRQNEYLRSGAKAGFGGSAQLGQDIISRAVKPNIEVTDFQRAIGKLPGLVSGSGRGRR